MFGIGGLKLVIILIAGLILIGPERLPEIARTIGKAIRFFNEAKDEMERMIKADMFAEENPIIGGKARPTDNPTPEPAPVTVADTLYDNVYLDDEEGDEE